MLMAQNQKHGFIIILIVAFFPSVLSAIVPVKGNSVFEKGIDDSAQVILFLDTTILGPFFFPVQGKVISRYGKRGSRMHTGTDIKLFHGDTVRAAFTGVVTKASTYYGYGILVILEHPQNLETYYAHLSKALVKEGDTIRYGTPVGLGGRTGRATTEHLHFEIRKSGKTLNSEHFFNFDESIIKSMVLLKTPASKKSKTTEDVVKVEEKTETKKEVVKPVVASRKYHTIRKGDTLFSLSRQYGKTVDELCKLNNLQKSSILVIGRRLRVN